MESNQQKGEQETQGLTWSHNFIYEADGAGGKFSQDRWDNSFIAHKKHTFSPHRNSLTESPEGSSPRDKAVCLVQRNEATWYSLKGI